MTRYCLFFLGERHDGSQRLTLNLKRLNQAVEKIHFKMDINKNAIALMKKILLGFLGFFVVVVVASIDLKNAYYSVSIAPRFFVVVLIQIRYSWKNLSFWHCIKGFVIPQDFYKIC